MDYYAPVDQHGRYIPPHPSLQQNPPPMNPPQQFQYYPPPPPPPPAPSFPKPETYTVLWNLAEEYFSGAQKLSAAVARTKNEQRSYEYYRLVLAGIKCLNAVLLLDRQKVSIKVEMQTRLRLAHVLVMETENMDMAEDLLSKGVLRIPKNSEFYDIKFAMQQLQATILSRTSLKASRSHIKNCLDEASDREMLMWQYSFLLTRLQHMHPQPDVHEITQHTNTVHTLRSLAQSNSDHELVELSYVLEISHALKFNISAIKVDNLLSLASDLSSRNPLRQHHIQLSLMRMLLHVLYLTKVGQGHAALAKLKEHHQLMDSEVGSNMRIWDKEGKFDLLVCNGERKLYFEWFTQSEAFVFGYLLSGAVYFPDSSAEKTLNFFMEGVRVADSILHKETYDTESWLSEVVTRRDRLCRLKRYSLLYASFAALLRSQWEVAIKATTQLTDFNKAYFAKSTSHDTAFTYLYHLLLAIQNHYTGHLDVALQYYSGIPVQAGEIYLLALLNKSLILRGGNQQDQTTAMKLIDEVERRLVASQHQYPQIRNAWCLVRGITSHEVLLSKELLNRVIQYAAEHLNIQLRTLALTITMARFFVNSSTEQAERLGLMAYVPAQKSRDQLWQLVNGNLLADVYSKQDKQAKKAKQDALNEEHRQRAADQFNLGKTS